MSVFRKCLCNFTIIGKYCVGVNHAHHVTHTHAGLFFRQLFTPAALGLDQYQQIREDTKKRFTNKDQLLKKRMCEVLATQEKPVVFTEDLKNVVHLVERNEEDLKLLRDMARRFNQQNEGLRFGMYIFGPVVMRTYHLLRQPQEALEALNDPLLASFFDQVISFQLLMDLLYKEGRYSDVLGVFGSLQERRIGGQKYHKNCLTLTFAACYKLNTQESFEHLQTLLNKTDEYGTKLNLRLLALSSALALSLHHPHVALELILKASAVSHIIVRSIKVISLSHLGRFQEAILTLRSITEIDRLNNTNKCINRQALEALEEAVKERGTKEESVQLKRLIKNLEDSDAVSNETIDDLVCKPIDKFEKNTPPAREMLRAAFVRPLRKTQQQQQQQQHSRNNNRQQHQQHHPRRLGLADME